jgi:hypothetical protein
MHTTFFHRRKVAQKYTSPPPPSLPSTSNGRGSLSGCTRTATHAQDANNAQDANAHNNTGTGTRTLDTDLFSTSGRRGSCSSSFLLLRRYRRLGFFLALPVVLSGHLCARALRTRISLVLPLGDAWSNAKRHTILACQNASSCNQSQVKEGATGGRKQAPCCRQ